MLDNIVCGQTGRYPSPVPDPLSDLPYQNGSGRQTPHEGSLVHIISVPPFFSSSFVFDQSSSLKLAHCEKSHCPLRFWPWHIYVTPQRYHGCRRGASRKLGQQNRPTEQEVEGIRPATSLALPTAVPDQAAATAAIAAKVAIFAHRVVSSTISHVVHRLDIRGAYAFHDMLKVCIGACNVLSIYARLERARARRPQFSTQLSFNSFGAMVVLVGDKDLARWRVLASRTQSGWIRPVIVRLLPKRRVRGDFLCEEWGWLLNWIERLDSSCCGCKDSTSIAREGRRSHGGRKLDCRSRNAPRAVQNSSLILKKVRQRSHSVQNQLRWTLIWNQQHISKGSVWVLGSMIWPHCFPIPPMPALYFPDSSFFLPPTLSIQILLFNSRNENQDFELVQDAALDANFEFDFDFPSQIEAGPDQGRMSQTPFTNLSTDLPQANPNEIFSSDMPGQEYEFPYGLETPSASSTIPETSILSNDYDQPTHHNPYSLNNPGQETALSNSLETSFYEPSSSQETSFSSTFSDFSHENQSLSEILASPDQSLSSEFETNHPDNQQHTSTPPQRHPSKNSTPLHPYLAAAPSHQTATPARTAPAPSND
ncbi:hypothetical protein NA56DRAFT_653871 [Hyaloscypha hepaticicola]|uniref:Uncharacterized protein n=1 Tax=Hyaloscypha hepaticicola TaxID=2082293 RepID=A0A2J6QL40_9HELO|nr:hypothetical protein NA56DRAFT_653871 [Hyaloscypha hepaticicola]